MFRQLYSILRFHQQFLILHHHRHCLPHHHHLNGIKHSYLLLEQHQKGRSLLLQLMMQSPIMQPWPVMQSEYHTKNPQQSLHQLPVFLECWVSDAIGVAYKEFPADSPSVTSVLGVLSPSCLVRAILEAGCPQLLNGWLSSRRNSSHCDTRADKDGGKLIHATLQSLTIINKRAVL